MGTLWPWYGACFGVGLSGCLPFSLLGFEFSPVNEPPMITETAPLSEEDSPGLVVLERDSVAVFVTVVDDDLLTSGLFAYWRIQRSNGTGEILTDNIVIPAYGEANKIGNQLTLRRDVAENYNGGELRFRVEDPSGAFAERSWLVDVSEEFSQ